MYKQILMHCGSTLQSVIHILLPYILLFELFVCYLSSWSQLNICNIKMLILANVILNLSQLIILGCVIGWSVWSSDMSALVLSRCSRSEPFFPWFPIVCVYTRQMPVKTETKSETLDIGMCTNEGANKSGFEFFWPY